MFGEVVEQFGVVGAADVLPAVGAQAGAFFEVAEEE